MNLKKAKKRFNEVAATAADKAKEIGGKAAENTSEGITKAKKSVYRPVFVETLSDPEFNKPLLVTIEDNSKRQGVDVMEGAIGWLSREGKTDVLHLYERYADNIGFSFFPRMECWSIFYADRFNNRYVNLDVFFDTMLHEKLAELQDVAYSLGAKSCTIEMYEMAKKVKVGGVKSKKGAKVQIEGADASAGRSEEISASDVEAMEKKTSFHQEFEGSSNPKEPALKWFATDERVLQLIKARCDTESDNRSTSYHLYIENTSSLSMSANAASKVDSALGKMKAELNFSIEGEARNEQRQVFKLDVEF